MTPLEQFARIIADGRRRRDSLPVAEAAREAHCAGGPSVAEIEALITRQRAERAA
jgi:hypothetical protein